MSTKTVAIGVVVLLIVAGIVIFLVRSGAPPAPRNPPEGPLPALPSEQADPVVAGLLEELSTCQDAASSVVCQQDSELGLRFAVRNGLGRVVDLRLNGGELDVGVNNCFRAAAERFRLKSDKQVGQLEIQFPLPCGPDGKLRILKPTSRGAARPIDLKIPEKKTLVAPSDGQ